MMLLVLSLMLDSSVFKITDFEYNSVHYNNAFAQMLEFQPIEFTNPHVVDAFGNLISEINVGQQVQFTADIKNNLDEDVEFAYVVTFDDLETASWISGTLTPGQEFSPSLSNIFKYSGAYTVKLYVVKPVAQILNPQDPKDYSAFAIAENQLAVPLSFKINVEYPVPPQELQVTSEEVKYDVKFVTTSEISSASFDKQDRKLSFIIDGPTGTKGTLTAEIPVLLLDKIFKVTINGEPLAENSWSVERFGLTNYLTMNYRHSPDLAEITGSSTGDIITTENGLKIIHNWRNPPPLNLDETHALILLFDPDYQGIKFLDFSVTISDEDKKYFYRSQTTLDDGTKQIRVPTNSFPLQLDEDGENLDVIIYVDRYNGADVNDLATTKVHIIPEYPTWIIMLILSGTIFLAIILTRVAKPISLNKFSN